VAIGSSTTVVDSVYDDPILCRRKEIFKYVWMSLRYQWWRAAFTEEDC
jgi:hypothetical protein